MIYTVTLNPALDYILRLPRLSSEDVNRADSAQLLCGGKGINVSMVLSGLEVPTRALGFVAGFTGRALEQMLQAQGIQTDFVPLAAGNTRINVKIFADRQTDINAPGAQPAEAEVEARESWQVRRHTAGRGRQHPLRGRGARQTGEQCRLRRFNGGRVPGRVRRQRRLQDGAPVGFRRR